MINNLELTATPRPDPRAAESTHHLTTSCLSKRRQTAAHHDLKIVWPDLNRRSC